MPVDLPAEDRGLSPYTGYTREHWTAIADRMLVALRPYFTSSRSHIELPGGTSSSGRASDAFEAFARSFLLFGFRLMGEDGRDPNGFLDWYRDGIVAGTDPRNPERWPRPDELPQAKVEAASIALVLQLTRPWVWDTLEQWHQQNVIEWFATVVGTEYHVNNWLWFRTTVETFLASVGGPFSSDDIEADLARHESFYREHGWYSDGLQRNFDYYCGWAMQLYPLLWARSEGAEAFGAAALEPVWRSRLSAYLDDYIHLIGADGVPVLQGRSLIYRFATAAPLWMGAYTGATDVAPGQLRRAASGILKAFIDRGALNDDDLLTMGLFGEWPQMAQSYSGSGSPYWAAKGMLGLALPADNPVWTAVEQPLPVETADTRRLLVAPGWLVSGTVADGIVRISNHGTDHALPGEAVTDSPIYARLGYSTATIPPLIGGSVVAPRDSAIVAIDTTGRASHRTGFSRGGSGDDGAAAYAWSSGETHWIEVTQGAGPGHGPGLAGEVTPGPRLLMVSLVRGPWEVRVALVASGAGRLRASGWPLAGEQGAQSQSSSGVSLRVNTPDSRTLTSEIVVLHGAVTEFGVSTEARTSPIGTVTNTPWIDFEPLVAGQSIAVAVRLDGDDGSAPNQPNATVSPIGEACSITVRWADGPMSSVTVPLRS